MEIEIERKGLDLGIGTLVYVDMIDVETENLTGVDFASDKQNDLRRLLPYLQRTDAEGIFSVERRSYRLGLLQYQFPEAENVRRGFQYEDLRELCGGKGIPLELRCREATFVSEKNIR